MVNFTGRPLIGRRIYRIIYFLGKKKSPENSKTTWKEQTSNPDGLIFQDPLNEFQHVRSPLMPLLPPPRPGPPGAFPPRRSSGQLCYSGAMASCRPPGAPAPGSALPTPSPALREGGQDDSLQQGPRSSTEPALKNIAF